MFKILQIIDSTPSGLYADSMLITPDFVWGYLSSTLSGLHGLSVFSSVGSDFL